MSNPQQTTLSQIERRLSEWVAPYNITIRTLDQRPDHPTGDVLYLVKDIFTTRNGSFEPASEPGSIPQWARDAYLNANFLEAGANHHLFAAIIGLDGELIKNHEIRYWSDGFDKLGDPDYTGYVREQTKASSGWANTVIFASSAYAPERGESGPWCWVPVGAAEVVCGGGLPANEAISTFVVWQAVHPEITPEEPDPGVPDPGGEPDEEEPEPGDGDPGDEPTPGLPADFVRRVGEWIQPFNIHAKTLNERPDNPEGDVVYLLKDIFTTRDGSWEPSANPGSVSQWARDAYLKPFGAPDYFDDAGADHHLFAAVIGLDGQLMREKEIIFWSDGFDKLGDPSYVDYVRRTTKSQSGWANIISGPGSSYIPERGESGPWCWAPTGAAEVICGGGMPAKQHVSIFAVWQAVHRSDLAPEEGDTDQELDHTIFLPFVMGSTARGQADALAPAEVSAPDEAATHQPELARLRKAAWKPDQVALRMSRAVEADPQTYARLHNLGMPVTKEFKVKGYKVQGYYGGIVYMPLKESEEVQHVDW